GQRGCDTRPSRREGPATGGRGSGSQAPPRRDPDRAGRHASSRRSAQEAAAVYEQLQNEKILPQRDEEVLQRKITALQLAGDYNGSDQNVARFQQTYPKSPLLPVVLFRHAENAYFMSQAAEKLPDPNAKVKEVARLQEESAKRYKAVIDQ